MECGEITRDYGVKQNMAKIEENSGKNLKILNGIWICSTTAVGLYISLNQLTDLYYFLARVQLVHKNILRSSCMC